MAFNSEPFEIVGAPFEIYLADVGTAFPAIDDDPAVGWALVGSSGSLNYFDEGVTIEHGQSFNMWRALGDNAVRKVFRTEESLVISVTVADVTLEQYALALNSNAVTDSSNSRKVGLSRGIAIATNSLLVRGPSPYIADANMQYEVPICVQTGEPEVVYRRGEPAGLALQWTALVDVDAATTDERFGRLVAQFSDTTA